MAIDALAAAANTQAADAAASRKSGQALSKLGEDYTSFLKLLTAQISNQDPLKPVDSTQFVSQLAQLSQVEQSVQTNANLETIAARLAGSAGMSEVALIGREVGLATDRIELSGGRAPVEYELSGPAARVRATILDTEGNVVRVMEGLDATGRGRVALDWDGRDGGGTALRDGAFRIEINAEDAAGETVGYQTYATSRVERVTFAEGGSRLALRNGEEVDPALLLSVSGG